jgi:hypothetical protein
MFRLMTTYEQAWPFAHSCPYRQNRRQIQDMEILAVVFGLPSFNRNDTIPVGEILMEIERTYRCVIGLRLINPFDFRARSLYRIVAQYCAAIVGRIISLLTR